MKKIKPTGIMVVVFFILGYQIAVFSTKASILRMEANRDHPDTVYVYTSTPKESDIIMSQKVKYQHSEIVQKQTRKAETFMFNPNTVSLENLERLGFSEKQAQSIINYREKGGKFRRKRDFRKSFVVSDEAYERLKDYIDIPKIDINLADTTQLVWLPGVGPYFARKIVETRERFRGYSFPEQLLDIYNFTQERYDGLSDLIICSAPQPYPLWELSEEELAQHPYLEHSAHGIILYKRVYDRSEWSVEGLIENNIIKPDYVEGIRKCRILSP